jgi:hypothetical protein
LQREVDANMSSGRAGAVGMLQAILQAMLQGAWPVDYSSKVLKGVVSAGYCACRAFWTSFLGIVLAACGAFCSWVLVLGHFIPGRFIPASSFLGVLDPRSWMLCSLLAGRFFLGPLGRPRLPCGLSRVVAGWGAACHLWYYTSRSLGKCRAGPYALFSILKGSWIHISHLE